MEKNTFVEKWIPFIGVAMPDEEKSLRRHQATDDLGSLSADEWWRKWGGFFHGWPGGAPKKHAYEDLMEVVMKYCLKCGKPATWEEHGFVYCEDHVPEDDFDPEIAELDVIEWFKRGGEV